MNVKLQEMIMDSIPKQWTGREMTETDFAEGQSTFYKIMELADVTRNEGILALAYEVSCFILEKSGCKVDVCDDFAYRKLSGAERLLSVLTRVVVCGQTPEHVEEVALMRYCIAGYEGTAALCAGMYITGILSMQKGEPLTVLKDKLLALFPETLENQLLEAEAAAMAQKEAEKGKIPESFFADKSAASSPIMEGFDSAILSMENADIKRMLRDTENWTLSICLQAAKGETRRRIFENMSDRLCEVVYGEMESMGPIRLRDAEEAAITILRNIQTLCMWHR